MSARSSRHRALSKPVPKPVPNAGSSRGARTVLPGQTPEGEYILSVLVKRTFEIVRGGQCTLAEEDRPLIPGDVFWDDPMNSSVRFESDFVPFKPATDIVLNGVAHAPGGAETTSCVVSFWVGDRAKSIAVIGDRVARYADGGVPLFTEPTPFTSTPLCYERAYGGTDVYSDPKIPYPYPRNPLGRGFVVRNTARTIDNLALPNFEDPTAPLTPETLCLEEYAAWESRPAPAGLGWIRKTWLPRALLAGIMPGDRAVEQELRQAYATLLPADQREPYLKHGIRDMDFGFFNGASPGLVVPFLAGGEWIGTENASSHGRLDFQLPDNGPRIGLDIGEGVREPNVVLQTVMIRMDDGQVDLVWRGAVPYRGPDWLPEMRKMDVLIT
ncbi:MAG TPA: DUF2169 domain-containing protein [Gemmatimonadaceae bacterium]|nr:DUF2169 domain-containing protein [Gemmatimonadaceae bacterium]